MSEHEWKIGKSAGQCQACGQAFAIGVPYYSALIQTAEGLTRADWCESCFETKRPADVFYFWKTAPRAPDAQAKKPRAIVDLDNVFEFFKRLGEESGPQRIAFRYILALMLARKKALFASEKKKDDQGRPMTAYREKKTGADQPLHWVVEPDLSEAEIQNLSAELGVLLGLGPQPEPAAAASTESGTSDLEPADSQPAITPEPEQQGVL